MRENLRKFNVDASVEGKASRRGLWLVRGTEGTRPSGYPRVNRHGNERV